MSVVRGVALAGMVGWLAAAPGGQVRAGTPRVVRVVAERFSFYPSEIDVVRGESIELRITSDDTSHGFRLLGPGGVDVDIPKRGRGDVRVVFDATEAGTFVFECSRVCGAGHSFMRGMLRVREPS
jgi:heme/copper-type cytochrome/quinol oxidase subunit 2